MLYSIGSIFSFNVGCWINEGNVYKEPAHGESDVEINVMAEPDPNDVVSTPILSTLQTDEPDPDDQEFQRINDTMTAVCNRLSEALEMLRSEVSAMQATSILQTLLKIIRYAYANVDWVIIDTLYELNGHSLALRILDLRSFKKYF